MATRRHLDAFRRFTTLALKRGAPAAKVVTGAVFTITGASVVAALALVSQVGLAIWLACVLLAFIGTTFWGAYELWVEQEEQIAALEENGPLDLLRELLKTGRAIKDRHFPDSGDLGPEWHKAVTQAKAAAVNWTRETVDLLDKHFPEHRADFREPPSERGRGRVGQTLDPNSCWSLLGRRLEILSGIVVALRSNRDAMA